MEGPKYESGRSKRPFGFYTTIFPVAVFKETVHFYLRDNPVFRRSHSRTVQFGP